MIYKGIGLIVDFSGALGMAGVSNFEMIGEWMRKF